MSDSASTQRRHTSRRIDALLLAGLLLMIAGGAAYGQDPSPGAAGPDTPVDSGHIDGEPWLDDGATPAEPEPIMLDPRERGWDRVVVGPDGRTLTIYFYDGVETCYGLHRVDVTQGDAGLDIRLWTGIRPEAVGMACIEIAQLYKTVVILDEPIITGGSF